MTKPTVKNRIRLKSKLRDLFFSPFCNVALMVLLLLSVFGGVRLLSTRRTPGQIKFIEQQNLAVNEQEGSANQEYPAPEIFKGEVYDTSIRLRESGALGMAISLAIFSAQTERRNVPPNLEKVWSLIDEKRLMPPDLELKNGELLSPSGVISVRYQAQPLRFEILSIPRQNKKSSALLLRFPLTSLDGQTITYFQSKVSRFEIPSPFSPPEKIVSAGWTLEQWRGELLPKQDNPLKILEEEKRLLLQVSTNH